MEEIESRYHVPVMLRECMDGLRICPSGIYVDVTFGGGGHSREILRSLNEEGRLYGFDQDRDAERNIPADPRFVFVRGNFRYLRNFIVARWTESWPTWVSLPIISTIRSVASPSGSTGHWICG